MNTTLDPAKNLPTEVDPTMESWEGHVDLIRRTVAQGASPDELKLFLYTARRAGLDPLARQIYYVRRQGKGTVQVSIDGLRLIADRTGRYAGGDAAEFLGETDAGMPAIARVTVYKMVGGVRCPFSATARWEEYYPGEAQGFTWRKMPHTMLAKCAEALALRRAFPADLSGLYTHEEMAQAGSPSVADANASRPDPVRNGMPAPQEMDDPATQPDPSPSPSPQPDPTPAPEPQTPIPGTPDAPDVPGTPGHPSAPDPYEPGPSPAPMPSPGPVPPVGDPPVPGIQMSGIQMSSEDLLAKGVVRRGAKSAKSVAPDAPKLTVVTNEPEFVPAQAFGYKPPKWPSAKMMSEAATENQFRMLRLKAGERHLSERELGTVRESVLAGYGVDEDASKGALSLVIDFLLSASPAQLDAARGVRKAA